MKENIKKSIIDGNKTALEDNCDSIKIIESNSNHNIKSIVGFQWYRCVRIFLYRFYIENDINNAKQSLFNAGKCEEFRTLYFDGSINPQTLDERITYILLSDNKELIKSFSNWKFNNHEYHLKNGASGFIIQEILKGNKEKALELIDVFEKKHRKYNFKDQDAQMYRAIVNNNKKEVEELLEFFLLPSTYKKRNDKLAIYKDLYVMPALGFAKLAWIKGIEVDIDHPLLPKELLPIKPNENYEIEYEFLKPDYKPNINTKKEIPKPNAKYKKYPPKNKIGVTKQMIERLIIDNWDATYTQKELKDNVDLIYLAFTNPQEFDKAHYDFAKLGNYHISHQDKDYIYIEDKPFTNMFTTFKDEIDYFFEVINVSFDIMGIQLVDGKQYEDLKKQLESNRDTNKGFFEKLFNN